jgi:hypothetical protein
VNKGKTSISPKIANILFALIVMLSVLTMWKSVHSAKAMSLVMNADAQMADVASGTTTSIVAQIEQMTSTGTMQATVLNKKTEEIYARSKVLSLFISHRQRSRS